MLFLYLGFLSHDIQNSQGSMGREMPILIPLIYQPGNQGDANFNSFLPFLMPILIPLTYQPGNQCRAHLCTWPAAKKKQRSVFRTVEHLQWCSFGKIVSHFPPLYRFYTLFSQKSSILDVRLASKCKSETNTEKSMR